MRLQIPASLSLLLLACLAARAQDADEFFHGGAQRYLSNNIPAALEVVTNGLQRFPDDEKLKKLYALLNQQQKQNQQQQQQQQNQKDQQKDQNKDGQKDKSKNDQQKQDEPKKQDQKKPDADKPKPKPEEKKEDAKPQPASVHAMTAQEARQLLDAQKGDEQVLVFRPPDKPKKNPEKPVKDW